jgi:hypothetical protein
MKNVFRIALLVTGAVLLSGSLPVFAQDIDIPPNIKPFIMPVAGQSGPSTWLMGQPYGNTTGAFNSGADQYSAGQFMHFGIDISMPCGTPLLAVADGEVNSVDDLSRGSAPHNLLLRFPELELVVLYGHLLERPALERGQSVTQGQVVALSGTPSGFCDSRPHLHLEVRSLNHANTFNPIDYIDAPWHSLLGIGGRGTPLFQRDLNNARQWMTITDQPDVRFGGTRLNNYAATMPNLASRRAPENPALMVEHIQPNPNWTVRQIAFDNCCVGAWWHPSDNNVLYVVDGVPGQLAQVYEITADARLARIALGDAPPPIRSADGTHQVIYQNFQTTIRRLADGAEWIFPFQGSYPGLSPDNSRLLWESDNGRLWVGGLDGSDARMMWRGGEASARWLDDSRLLISIRGQQRFTTLHVVNVADGSSYVLGTWFNLRGLRVAPGGGYLAFSSSFNGDPALDGVMLIATAPGASAQKMPWYADYRWRDAESLYYLSYNPTSDIQQLHYYHVGSNTSMPLTQPDAQPFTIGGADWAVSPDGGSIIFQEARDNNLWLLEAAHELAESPSD